MIAAEQKARTTYDNLLRLIKDPEIYDPIRFLREREIVHYQRFGEAKSSYVNKIAEDTCYEESSACTLFHILWKIFLYKSRYY